MIDAFVHGVGLWTPGHPDAASWHARRRHDDALRPAAELLAGPSGRRATALTRMAAEALGQALKDAGRDPAAVATVWATAHGEHETAVAILEMLVTAEGRLSPTRFHNSVYNTASGYASIATGNRAPSTTLAGGPDLVAMALLEADCLLASAHPDVALVLADEPMRPPFDARGAEAPLALAFCLSREAGGARARVRGLVPASAPGLPEQGRFGGLYVSAALPLLDAVLAGRSARVPLELDAGRGTPVWSVEVSPPSEAASPP